MASVRLPLLLVGLVGCGSGTGLPPGISAPADGPSDAAMDQSPEGGADSSATDTTDEAPPCADSPIPWAVTVQLNHADCDTRPITSCARVEVDPLGWELNQLAIWKCFLSTYVYVNVEFVGGCPAVLRIRTLKVASEDRFKPLTECLTIALQQQHWECGGDRCATVYNETIP